MRPATSHIQVDYVYFEEPPAYHVVCNANGVSVMMIMPRAVDGAAHRFRAGGRR